MKRTLKPLNLSKSPLVIVLCQVRVAAIRDMESYIPKIQDRLRKEKFPIDVSGEVLEFGVQDGQPVARRHPHWDFRTKDERWSVIVEEKAIVLQTTAYTDFDAFLKSLVLTMETVSDVVRDLVVERIGLRYVDLIRPLKGESWKDYVQPSLHGLENDIVHPDRSLLFSQTIAQTGENSRMIVRLAQNRDGMVVPPDLVSHHPALQITALRGELLTLLDLDHYHEERADYSREVLERTAWELHDGLDILFRDTVTQHALEAWQ